MASAQLTNYHRPVASTSKAATSSLGPGPPPDLTERFKLKAAYLRLQRDYFRALETRKDLTMEAKEKQDKIQALQDEVNLLIDQIHDSDYAHLEPEDDDLFSPSEGEDDDDNAPGDTNKAKEGAAGSVQAAMAAPGYSSASNGSKVRKSLPDSTEQDPLPKRVRLDEASTNGDLSRSAAGDRISE